MKIDRLTTTKVTSSTSTAPITALDERDLKHVAGGVDMSDCAVLVTTGDGLDIGYHSGYPR